MHIPVWVTVVVAILVIGFGIHRIRLSRRTPAQEADAPRRRGLYGMSARAHLVIGLIYLALGGALLATSLLGWNPFGSLFGPETQLPAKDTAPSKVPIPIDQMPPRK